MAEMISIVVPCLNEQEVLRQTNRRLLAVLEQLPLQFEILYVDDGSSDATPDILREFQALDERIRVVRFSRNFGHQLAITAGLQHASGDAVAIMDADLQDPPEVLADFVAKWMDGYDVVYGVRAEREGETAFKRGTAKLFYRLIGKLSDTRNSGGHGRFPADEQAGGGCLAGDAGARPLRARHGELAGIFAGGDSVPPRSARRGSDEIFAVQDDAVCDGRSRVIFDSAAASGYLGGIRRFRDCNPGHPDHGDRAAAGRRGAGERLGQLAGGDSISWVACS